MRCRCGGHARERDETALADEHNSTHTQQTTKQHTNANSNALVVRRVGRRELALPVVREAERLQLRPEAVDVARRRDGRVRARLDRVLLGGQAERVPAHRVQHVEAAHALVAREDVGRGVAFRVADVQAGAAVGFFVLCVWVLLLCIVGGGR